MKTVLTQQENEVLRALREVIFLRTCRHPFIVDIHDAFLTFQPKMLCMILTYCDGGDLGKLIKTTRNNNSLIPEQLIIKYSIQIALALHFLHENQILHCDLKPSNIIVYDSGELIKLADFGLSIELLNNICYHATEVGTPLYTSPEMCEGLQYSYPSDCWAFGICLYELMLLRPPFDALDTTQLVKSITRDEPPEISHQYSNELRAISKLFLCKDPNQRLGFAGMLSDPFISNKLSMVTSYRSKVIDERTKRCHIKQLQSQLEVIRLKTSLCSSMLLPSQLMQQPSGRKEIETPSKQIEVETISNDSNDDAYKSNISYQKIASNLVSEIIYKVIEHYANNNVSPLGTSLSRKGIQLAEAKELDSEINFL